MTEKGRKTGDEGRETMKSGKEQAIAAFKDGFN